MQTLPRSNSASRKWWNNSRGAEIHHAQFFTSTSAKDGYDVRRTAGNVKEKLSASCQLLYAGSAGNLFSNPAHYHTHGTLLNGSCSIHAITTAENPRNKFASWDSCEIGADASSCTDIGSNYGKLKERNEHFDSNCSSRYWRRSVSRSSTTSLPTSTKCDRGISTIDDSDSIHNQGCETTQGSHIPVVLNKRAIEDRHLRIGYKLQPLYVKISSSNELHRNTDVKQPEEEIFEKPAKSFLGKVRLFRGVNDLVDSFTDLTSKSTSPVLKLRPKKNKRDNSSEKQHSKLNYSEADEKSTKCGATKIYTTCSGNFNVPANTVKKTIGNINTLSHDTRASTDINKIFSILNDRNSTNSIFVINGKLFSPDNRSELKLVDVEDDHSSNDNQRVITETQCGYGPNSNDNWEIENPLQPNHESNLDFQDSLATEDNPGPVSNRNNTHNKCKYITLDVE